MRVTANVDIHVLHISGEENAIADTVSRALFDQAKTLSPLVAIHDFTPTNTISSRDPLSPPLTLLGNKKMNIALPMGWQPPWTPWPMDHLLRERAIALGNTIEPSTCQGTPSRGASLGPTILPSGRGSVGLPNALVGALSMRPLVPPPSQVVSYLYISYVISVHHPTCRTSLIFLLYVLTFHMCPLSIMLLVTGTSVLISYLYIAADHYVYIPLWSWVSPQLVIDLVSGHPLLSDLEFPSDLCTGLCASWSIPYTTLRTYNSALNSYLTFVRLHNLSSTPTEDTLSFYVVYMSHHISDGHGNVNPCGIVGTGVTGTGTGEEKITHNVPVPVLAGDGSMTRSVQTVNATFSTPSTTSQTRIK